jgi:branched-chain amino acid aminotransferase
MTQDPTLRYPDGVISVNGVISAPEDACIPAMDHGFLFGDSVYEVVRTLDGLPVAWPAHFERLSASAASLYMDLPWTRAQMGERIVETIAATGLPECTVRMVVTRGPGPMSLLPDACDGPRLVVYVLPLRLPPEEHLTNGIRISVPSRLRNDSRALAPAAKTGNYLNNLLALVEARRAGGTDAVMVNTSGHVTEGTTSNVFWVRGGVVRTASLDCGILSGITRHELLAEMRADGLTVEEGGFPLEDLTGADEAFLTGTVRGVTPVVDIDGQLVGTGRPGPVTLRVVELLRRTLLAARGPW